MAVMRVSLEKGACYHIKLFATEPSVLYQIFLLLSLGGVIVISRR